MLCTTLQYCFDRPIKLLPHHSPDKEKAATPVGRRPPGIRDSPLGKLRVEQQHGVIGSAYRRSVVFGINGATRTLGQPFRPP